MEASTDKPIIVLREIHSENDLPDNFLRHYHTHLFCHKGQLQFLFNDQKMECRPQDFLFWFAESRLSGLQFSKGFKATVLLVENQFLGDNVPDQAWSINATLHSRVYPVKTIQDKGNREKILYNFQQIHKQYMDVEHRFYKEMLRLQMQQFILEMWHIFASEYEKRKHTLQTGTHYERFMQLAQEHCMTQREVQFYANELNITPKYLNQVSKANSGITASEWIQRYAKERIIILLQNKNLNITEIADEMEFSSRSFFTRYVKKLLGVTPKEYRERLQ